MLTISIAMATYNGEKFLAQQLASLVNQARLPDEIVISDDCSDDDTPLIIERFAKSAKCTVRYNRNENRLGWRANFIKAVGLCTCDLIALCDQDDIWLPDKLSVCLLCFDDEAVLCVHHSLQLIDESGRDIGTTWTNNSFPRETRALQRNILWHHPGGLSMIFRRSLTKFDHLWPQSLDKFFVGEPSAHDQWYFGLSILFGDTVFIDRPLVLYRQHGNNTVGIGASDPLAHLNDADRHLAELTNNLRVIRCWCTILQTADLSEFPTKAGAAVGFLIKQSRFIESQISLLTGKRSLRQFAGIIALYFLGGYSTKYLGRREMLLAMRYNL